MDSTVNKLLQNSSLIKTAIDTAVLKNRHLTSEIDDKLYEYMKSHKRKATDPITYEDFINLSALINSVTSKMQFQILSDALNHILNDAALLDAVGSDDSEDDSEHDEYDDGVLESLY